MTELKDVVDFADRFGINLLELVRLITKRPAEVDKKGSDVPTSTMRHGIEVFRKIYPAGVRDDSRAKVVTAHENLERAIAFFMSQPSGYVASSRQIYEQAGLDCPYRASVRLTHWLNRSGEAQRLGRCRSDNVCVFRRA